MSSSNLFLSFLFVIIFGTATAAAAAATALLVSVSVSAFVVCASSLHPSMTSPAYSIIYGDGGSDDDDDNITERLGREASKKK